MRRRFISIFLTLAVLFTVAPVSALADETNEGINSPVFTGKLTISNEAIEMIKKLEGYISSPFDDYTQKSIGYGCSTAYAKKYGFSTEYLSEGEAHQLMLFVLDEMEAHLDEFLDTYAISVNQFQYDALMSLTYNLGKNWMRSDSRIGELLVNGGYTVNEIASAFGLYCHIGTGVNAKIDSRLVSRRIQETKLFLYGAYRLNDVPQKFSRLTFMENHGGDYPDVGLYQDGEPYQILFEPDPTGHEGEYFVGWFTENGEKITALDTAFESMEVYPQWVSDIEWAEDPELTAEGTPYVPTNNPPLTERDYSDGSQSTQKPDDESEAPDYSDEDYEEASTVFADLDPEQWHYKYVNDLYNSGIIDGYEDHTFRPERSVSCGEALKMIFLAAGYPEVEATSDHWASGYYELAAAEGIIDDTDFKAHQLDVEINRQTMAKIVANALGLTEFYDMSPYFDTDNVFACILYYYDITEGYEDGTFRPERSLTRAELSTIVWRIYNEF